MIHPYIPTQLEIKTRKWSDASSIISSKSKEARDLLESRSASIHRLQALNAIFLQRVKSVALGVWSEPVLILCEERRQQAAEIDSRWHPSIGIQLPKLPRTWTSLNTQGMLVIEDYPKYKMFKSNHTGPTASSFWSIPGRILAGGYPVGQAFPAVKKVVSHSDAASSILLRSIGTFVCLMTSAELEEATERDGTSYMVELSKKRERLDVEFTNAVAASKARVEFLLHAIEQLHFKEQIFIKEDFSYFTLEQKAVRAAEFYDEERIDLNLKLKTAREKVETSLQSMTILRPIVHLHYAITKNEIPTQMEEFIVFLKKVEQRLRVDNVYVFSKDGHGRAGVLVSLLLGRLYGLPPKESLQRTQWSHDTRSNSSQLGALSISSPSSMQQLRFVAQVLQGTDSMYAPIYRVSAHNERFTGLYRKRGMVLNENSQEAWTDAPTEESILEDNKVYQKQRYRAKREARGEQRRRQQNQ